MSTATGNPVIELIAGHPALDLVNTLDWRFRQSGTEELLNTYGDLIRFAEESKLLTPMQARELRRTTDETAGMRVLYACRELREAIAEAVYAGFEGREPSLEAVRVLEQQFKAARGHRRLVWEESRVEWTLTGSDPALPLWLLALSAERLMTSDGMHKVRECGNAECRWVFLDTSKNHTRRWCDMKICGNRMKARRFKAQRRA
jgi:predicted RNA-binding Zn ribbon-like protein